MSYAEFLARKAVRVQPCGLEASALSPLLFPFQRDLTAWALRQGRAALFEECGLGKSWQAIEWARVIAAHTGKPVLILTPLAVAQQFVDEGRKLGVEVRRGNATDGAICVTNYEQLDHVDVSRVGGIVLDESSILKSFDGKTRTRLIETFTHVPYRLCCTATPSPNDFTELGNHAEFLGVMRRVDMLNRFFEHAGDNVAKWTLKGHARRPFWRWVSGWSRCIARPSDMGYSDDGYDLPGLVINDHVVDVDAKMARNAGLLFAYEATTLSDQRAVRRASLDDRVAMASEIANASAEQFTIWCELNDESTAITAAIPGAIEITGSDSTEKKEANMSAFLSGERRVLVTKSAICGFGVNLQRCADTIFAGTGHSFESFYQTVRRHYRFGQTRQVNCHMIRTSADGRIVGNLQRKQQEHEAMVREMVKVTREI